MDISEDLRSAVAPYLALFEGEPPALSSFAGRPGMALGERCRLGLPAGAGVLFLKLLVPPAALEAGPLPLSVCGPEGGELTSLSLTSVESWVLVELSGQRRIELRFGRTWDAPGSPRGAFLADLELLHGPVMTTFPWGAPQGADQRFLTLRMDLTNKCNLRCRMCSLSFDEVFFQPKDYMTPESFRKLAEEVLPHTAQLSLSAGFEPLLNPEFPEILCEAARYAVPLVEFTTNGSLLTEALVNTFIDCRVSRVTISIDGARLETFEHIRRGARFDRFLRNLETFARVRRERGAQHPELCLQMVLMRRNVDELSELIRLGHRYGMELFHSMLLVPFAGLDMEGESLERDRERANAAFAEARRTCEELGIRHQIPPDFDLSRPELEVVAVASVDAPAAATPTATEPGPSAMDPSAAAPEPEVLEIRLPPPSEGAEDPAERTDLPAPRDFAAAPGGTLIPTGFASQQREAIAPDGTLLPTACIYPWTMAVIRPDRHVIPCCQWHDVETMGSLDDRSFAAIWDGPAYRRLRAELQTGRFRPTCDHCPERRRI